MLADQMLNATLLPIQLIATVCLVMKEIHSLDALRLLKSLTTTETLVTHLLAVKTQNVQSITMLPNVLVSHLTVVILTPPDADLSVSWTLTVLRTLHVSINTVVTHAQESVVQTPNALSPTIFQSVAVPEGSVAILSVDAEKKLLSMFHHKHPKIHVNHPLADLTLYAELLMQDLLVHV
jgi:hypothetical protein